MNCGHQQILFVIRIRHLLCHLIRFHQYFVQDRDLLFLLYLLSFPRLLLLLLLRIKEPVILIKIFRSNLCFCVFHSLINAISDPTRNICKNSKVKFFKSNDMVPDFDLPGDTKKQFENITMIEELLISPIFAFMSIFRLLGGLYVSRGYMANFSQDIGSLIKQLQQLVKDLQILLIKKKNQKIINRFKLNINRNRVYLFKLPYKQQSTL